MIFNKIINDNNLNYIKDKKETKLFSKIETNKEVIKKDLQKDLFKNYLLI